MDAGRNQKDKATAASSCSSVEKDSGRNEKDSKPSLETSSDAPTGAPTGSYQDQEVVQEEEAHPVKFRPVGKCFFRFEVSSRELVSMRSKKKWHLNG
jgi:hypothetical protein